MILPDVIRPLRAFAGPITWVIWIVITGLVCMTALAVRRPLRRTSRDSSLVPRHSSLNRLVGTVIVFLATLAAAGTAGVRLRDTLTYPSGDEPHYMVVMQSLWRDHDLKIQNNYIYTVRDAQAGPGGGDSYGYGLRLAGDF